MTKVAFEGTPAFVLRALRPERTSGTDLLRGSVVKALAVGVQRFWLQELACRTTIGVRLGVVVESRFRKDLTLQAPLGSRLPQVGDVGPEPSVMTSQKGVHCPILAVRHRRRRTAAGVTVMTIYQGKQPMGLVGEASLAALPI